jgi:hypothetical protein
MIHHVTARVEMTWQRGTVVDGGGAGEPRGSTTPPTATDPTVTPTRSLVTDVIGSQAMSQVMFV